jgi:long-subunit fatty acid transport protein
MGVGIFRPAAGRWGSATLFAMGVSAVAFGAGYERTISWSGKHAGLAGAGVTARGAEALYFNPAGLAGAQTVEVSANVSPTTLSSQGPIFAPNQTLESNAGGVTPVFGALGAVPLAPGLSLGLGTFVSGGAKSQFTGLDVSGLGLTAIRPNAVSNVTLIEYSIGLAYQVAPRFKVGAAWRVLDVSGRFETPVLVNAATMAAIALNDLNQTRFNGLRFGAQYDGPGWGLGTTLRTSVSFQLQGRSSGQLETALLPGTLIPLNGGPVTVSNNFPLQITFGGYADLVPSVLRLYAEYGFTRYTENRQLGLTGTLQGPAPIGAIDLSTRSIDQSWDDQHVGRFALQYRVTETTALRAGYAFTSAVTPKARAKATFASPGAGHGIAVGAGHSMLNGMLDVDVAADYSFASGVVAAADVPAGSDTRPGDYGSSAFALHGGVTYRF